jgi:sulfite reductase (NADPH) flavoprotein alpha-component
MRSCQSPFFARIKQRTLLNKEGSTKKAYHVVINLTSAPFFYQVGDALGIIPSPEERPRLYSIASSPSISPNEAHLLVATFVHTCGKPGLTSHFLTEEAEVGITPIATRLYRTPSFRLPKDPSIPIIMIGAGVGIAPYRAFLQERTFQNAPGKNWLIFGERNRAFDFYFEKELLSLERQNRLRLDLAFSRDQSEKIYVQHKLLENGPEIWRWLEEGATFYVCGDAKHMAKEVNIALHHIIEKEGNLSLEAAKEYTKSLRREKRYLLDIY